MTKSIDELAIKVWAEVSKSATVGKSIAKEFARALIAEYEADQGEAVAWEARRMCHGDDEWSNWQSCTSEQAARYSKDETFQVRQSPRPDPRVKELEARLEVADHGWDGISCRNETIRLQDEKIEELERQLAEVTEAMNFNFEQYQDAGRLLNEECAKTEALTAQLGAKQAQIDALMLEYCPKEMTAEQLAEWTRNQSPE